MYVAGIILTSLFIGALWSAVGYLICLLIFEMMIEGPFDFFNPCWIYNHVRVNIIGCILLTIFVYILNPIAVIGYWIYKICTIGRKY